MKHIITLFAASLALTACSTVGSVAAPSLEGTSWRLDSVDGVKAEIGTDQLVRFEEGRIGGSVGCNRFGGPYAVEGNVMTFPGAMISTKMACPGPRMEQENAAFSVLTGNATVGFPDDTTMTLTGQNGRTLTFKRGG